MKLAVLLVSRNRPDLVQAMVAQLENKVTVPYDLFVVECGTDLDKLTPHTSAWYPDADFRGKCYGHNVALELANLRDRYDYFWILMNDLVFDGAQDPARTLIETMEKESRMAILSPTNLEGGYPAAAPKPGGDWRSVTTCDYLGFMLKASALDECGFLNPDFKYCWGAIHELAYKLNSHGWFVAYSDRVSYRHLGGTTYGAKGTNTISRDEYQRRAKRFAFDYFRDNYGDNWDELFFAAAEPFHPEVNTFREHKQYWASAFTADELASRARNAHNVFVEPSAKLVPDDRAGLVKLHLGCGPEKRDGWINVDTQAEVKPDIVSSVESLPMFPNSSVDVIEANHLFEHLTFDQAKRALIEWSRILRPGGELFLELPDLEACIRILGRHQDERGFDLGLIGIYGWPPAIEAEGMPQVHKWGWTKKALADELRTSGFTTVEFGPITQTWRAAAKVGRDLRLRAVRAGAVRRETPVSTPNSASNDARIQLFTWPNWRAAEELTRLFTQFGREIAATPGARMVLRFDPMFDGSEDLAMAALRDAYATVLGDQLELDVLILDSQLEVGDWEKIGSRMTAIAELPSSSAEPRRAACIAMGSPRVADVGAWRTAVAKRGSTPRPNRAGELRSKIEALNPWFYPIRIGPVEVEAGVGSPVTHEFLVNHTHCRATLLVDEVARRFDLKNKSVLELASNCGYWSSRYAELGATRVVGLEGRDQFLEQAELYWSENRFLPSDRATFLRGNVADRRDWNALFALGPFDFTLIAGILYHVPNYGDVLKWASEVTREALVIDTRVVHGDETIVDEPGELRFNAIEATRRKVVPNLKELVRALEELGFAAEILPVAFPEAIGVENVDSFVQRNRVAVFAKRVRVPNARALQTSGSASAS